MPWYYFFFSYQRMRVEQSAQLEAMRLRDQEEMALSKQYGPKKAKEIAEKKYRSVGKTMEPSGTLSATCRSDGRVIGDN